MKNTVSYTEVTGKYSKKVKLKLLKNTVSYTVLLKIQ